MIKREKEIRGIECCMRENNTNMCGDCPYHDFSETRFGCMRSAMRDALALLKEKEPVEATEKQKEFAKKFGITVPQYWCGECHYMLAYLTRFCPNCGKKVKWDG